MKHIKQSVFTLIVNGVLFFPALGQEKAANSQDESKIQSDYYSILSAGANRPIYRDFATSPLFYNGFGLDVQTAWLKRSEKRERLFDMGIAANTLNAKIPESNFLQAQSSAFLIQLNASYSQLFALDRFSTDKSNIKVGGLIRTTQNFRVNPSLQNNALGLENSTNIMASGQIIRDISRNAPKELNLLVFKPTLKPVKRDLRFQLNAGILNFNYRPSYAYSYEGEIIGIETQPLSWVLSNYKWSLNGYRLNTEIEYIKYMPNGNARSLSYVWDAVHMPGRYESFQMASHQIRYRIFFHNKKR
jgi:hypothetical protein